MGEAARETDENLQLAAAQAVQQESSIPPIRKKRIHGDLLALVDFDRRARGRLPNMIYKYVAGAVETGSSMAASETALESLQLLPRMFRDVSGRDQSISLFGKTYSAPFGIAPIGGAAFIAYRGDLELARAARVENVPMILSASSLIRLEDVHEANPDAWYQAYLAGDQSRIDRLINRVADAGFETLVVTGDTPMLGNREHNIRSGFSMPIKFTPKMVWQCATAPRWTLGVVGRTFLRHGAPHFENTDADRGPPMLSRQQRNTEKRDELSWRHVEAIRRQWKGNLVVKGIIAPEDARIARECGADAVMMSNHGGRQLDAAVSPFGLLDETLALSGDMKVIVDSGFRRGTDVLKAFALGADFTFIGRPFIFAAAIGGSDTVRHAITLLKSEIDRDLALIGVKRPEDLDRSYLRRIAPRAEPLAERTE